MDMTIVQSRIDESTAKLQSLEEQRRQLINDNRDKIQEALRTAVAAYVTSIESEVTTSICGKELADIDAQIARVKEDLDIFKSIR